MYKDLIVSETEIGLFLVSLTRYTVRRDNAISATILLSKIEKFLPMFSEKYSNFIAPKLYDEFKFGLDFFKTKITDTHKEILDLLSWKAWVVKNG